MRFIERLLNGFADCYGRRIVSLVLIVAMVGSFVVSPMLTSGYAAYPSDTFWETENTQDGESTADESLPDTGDTEYEDLLDTECTEDEGLLVTEDGATDADGDTVKTYAADSDKSADSADTAKGTIASGSGSAAISDTASDNGSDITSNTSSDSDTTSDISSVSGTTYTQESVSTDDSNRSDSDISDDTASSTTASGTDSAAMSDTASDNGADTISASDTVSDISSASDSTYSKNDTKESSSTDSSTSGTTTSGTDIDSNAASGNNDTSEAAEGDAAAYGSLTAGVAEAILNSYDQAVSDSDSSADNKTTDIIYDDKESAASLTAPVADPGTDAYHSVNSHADASGTTGVFVQLYTAVVALLSASSDSVDMTDYITGASFSTDSITAGETIKVTINYQIASQELKTKGTDVLTYTLPDGISVLQDYSGTVYDSNGNAVGTYNISKSTGTIIITLYDDFVNSGNTITGDISFWATLGASGTEDGEEVEYTFSDSNSVTTTITITSQPTSGGGGSTEPSGPSYDLTVDKSVSYTKDADDKVTATYTIVLYSQNGTGSAITYFLDTLTNSSSDITYTITPSTTFKDSNGTTYNFSDYFTISENKISLKGGSSLPELEAGESYTITYTVTYEGISGINGDVALNNSVTASNGNTSGNDETNIKFSHSYISKTRSYDSVNDQIKWTIMINSYGADIDGFTFSDTMTSTDGTNTSNVATGTIYIEEHLSNGTTQTYEVSSLPVTFRKIEGTAHTAGDTETTGEGTILYVADTTDAFIVTYYTDTSDVGFGATYNNEGTLSGNGNNYSTGVIEQQVIHDNGTLTKSYVEDVGAATNADGDTIGDIYSWESTIQVPSDGIKAGSYYYDVISDDSNYALHYITLAQLQALTIQYKQNEWTSETIPTSYYEIQVKDGSGNWVNISSISDTTATFTEFRIYFTTAISQATYPTLVISYNTTTDSTNLMTGAVATYTNTAQFHQDGVYVQASDSTKESSGGYVVKSDVTLETLYGDSAASMTSGTYTYDEIKGVLYYQLYVNVNKTMTDDGDIIIVDTLPEGTTLYTESYYNAAGAVNGTDYNDTDSHVKAYYENANGGWVGVFQMLNKFNPYVGNYDPNTDIQVSYNEETRELTIIIPQDVYYGYLDNGSEEVSMSLVIYYAAQITDVLGGDEVRTYKNNLQMSTTTSDVTSEDSVESTVTSSYVSKMLDSTAETSSDLRKAYTVYINPTGEQLNYGKPYTVTDTVEYGDYITSVVLVPGSFHLYRLTKSGTKGAEIDPSLYTVKYEEVTEDGKTSFVMTITVDDATPYVMEYEYAYTVDTEQFYQDNGYQSGTLDITNTITMSGSASDGSQSEEGDGYYIVGSAAHASTGKVTLVKEDESNQVIYLQGAYFNLYKFNTDAYAAAGSGADYTDDAYWDLIGTLITGEDGTVYLSGLEKGCAYCIKEIEAPTNYDLETDPFYFYYEETYASWPDELKAAAMEDDGMVITMLDTANNKDETSLAVTKNWSSARGSELSGSKITDASGNVITSIELKLYRTTNASLLIGTIDVTAEGWKAIQVTPAGSQETADTVWVSADNNGDWYYVFNHLASADDEDNTYYYYAVETGNYKYKDSDNGDAETDGANLSSDYVVTEDLSADGSSVVITNTKNASSLNVSVTKQWASGTTSSDISVTLYQSSMEPTSVEQKTINVTVNVIGAYGTNTMTGSITMYSGDTLDIRITPSWLTFDSSATYTIGGSAEGNVLRVANSDGTYSYLIPDVTGDVVLNVNADYSNSGESMSLAVGGSTRGMYDLPGDATVVDTETLGSSYANQTVENTGYYSSDGYTFTWTDLPDTYFYYVVEGDSGAASGYTASYEYTTNEEGMVTGVVITNATNTSKYTSVSVEKQWDDSDNKYDTRTDSITAKLYRSTIDANGPVITVTVSQWNGGTPAEDDTDSYIDVDIYQYQIIDWNEVYTLVGTVHLNSANNWTATIADPNYTDGMQYYWTGTVYSSNCGGSVTGASASSCDPSYNYKNNVLDGTGTFYLSATCNSGGGSGGGSGTSGGDSSGGTTSGTVSDATSSSNPYLFAGTDATAYMQYMGEAYDIVLSAENNWTASWSDLPATDGSGNPYYYYVTEVSVDGYLTSYEFTFNEDGQITGVVITNTLENPPEEEEKTSISVTKEWLKADGTAMEVSSDATITVKLMKDSTVVDTITLGSPYSGGIKRVNGTITGYYSSDGWTYTWRELDAGTYYVEEQSSTSVNGGNYTITYQSANATTPTDTAASAAVTEGNITIINTMGSTSIEVEKVWSGMDSDTDTHDVTFDLYRSTTALSEGEDTISLTVDVSKWYYSNGMSLAQAADASGSMIWVGVYAAEDGTVTDWNTTVDGVTLGAWNDWTWTTTLPAGSQYYVIYSCGGEISAADAVSHTGGSLDSGGWLVDGDTDDNRLDLAATLTTDKYEGEDTDINITVNLDLGSIVFGSSDDSTEDVSGVTLAGSNAKYVNVYVGIFNTTSFETPAYYTLSSKDDDGEGKWTWTCTVPGTIDGIEQNYMVLYSFGEGVYAVSLSAEGDTVTAGSLTFSGSADGDVEVSVSGTLDAYRAFLTGGKAVGNGADEEIDEDTGEDTGDEEEETTSAAKGTDGSYYSATDAEYVTSHTVSGTVTETSNWSYTFDNLDQYDEDGNLYYYYIVESAVDGNPTASDGYYTSYEYTWSGTEGSSALTKVTVTNTKAITITVTKAWVDADGNPLSAENLPDGITVDLMKVSGGSDPEVAEEVLLNAYNNWTYTWELPYESGVSYYAVETDGNGYTVTYQAETDGGNKTPTEDGTATASEATLSGSGTITITNTYEEDLTSLTVSKVWDDNGVDHSSDEVTMNLYRFSTAPVEGQTVNVSIDGLAEEDSGSLTIDFTWVDSDGNMVGAPESGASIWFGLNSSDWSTNYNYDEEHDSNYAGFSSDNNWSVTFTGLKLGESYIIQYGNGYDPNGSLINPMYGDDAIAVTITLSEDGQTVHLQGIVDADNAGWTALDKVVLSDANAGADGYSEDGWSYTWSDLLAQDADGNDYIYYVLESPISGYTTTYDYDTADGGDGSTSTSLTVTNTRTTTITVSKKWINADGEEITNEDDIITVQLYQKTSKRAEATAVEGEDGTVILSKDNDWTYTWDNLPYGNYYYVEECGLTGYSVTYTDITDDSGEDEGTPTVDPSSLAMKAGAILITNTQDSNKTKVTVEKKWNDGNQTHTDDVSVTLYRYKVSASETSDSGASVVSAVANDPLTLAALSASAGTGDGSLTVTVPNWEDADGNVLASSLADAPMDISGSISFTLYQCNRDADSGDPGWGWDINLGTYTLSAANGWQIMITGLATDERYLVNYWCSTDTGNVISGVYNPNGDEYACYQLVTGADTMELTAVVSSTDSMMEAIGSDGTVSSTDSATIKLGSDKKDETNYSEDGWAYTWDNLPMFAEDGLLYRYIVVENAVDGYLTGITSSTTTNEDKSTTTIITVTNTLKTSVSVTKVWLDADGNIMDDEAMEAAEVPGDISLALCRATGSGDAAAKETVGWVSIGSDYATSDDENLSEGGQNTPNDAQTATVTVKITNWYDEIGNELTSDDLSDVNGIWVGIYSEDWSVTHKELWIASYNTWTDTWTEAVVGTTYCISYNGSGISDSNISIGLEVTSGNVSDSKITVNGDMEIDMKATIYTVSSASLTSLLSSGSGIALADLDEQGQEEQNEDPITVTAGYSLDGWTYTWTDLPAYDEDGNAYTYTIEEVQVDGYTSTVSDAEAVTAEDGSTVYQITVTNQKKAVDQGVTLPGTGAKYMFVIYCIGLVLFALAIVWVRAIVLKRRHRWSI